MAIDWDLIFKSGSLAGFASFVWLVMKDFLKFYRRPVLVINFSMDRDLRTWSFKDTAWTRKVATLHVENNGKDTAKRCVAILKIIEKPGNVQTIEDKYALHWAGVDYTMQTTGAEPVDIGLEPRRLDVAFTQLGQNVEGCWVAIPFALSGHIERNQAYLSPGAYEVEIEVKCENGKGDKARFKIVSPDNWDNLDFVKI